QDVSSVVDAVSKFDNLIDKVDPIDCRHNAMNFSRERFQTEIKSYVEDKWNIFNDSKNIQY
ncbi:glycosyltransferase family 4 protein, partial [Klebsiella pneumoniae]|nr:glycosyltransferase family 4 protein [Klebsiella pneumoniae]